MSPDTRSILEAVESLLSTGSYVTGYCCCGDKMEHHDIGSGHSPVDAGDWHAHQIEERVRDAIEQPAFYAAVMQSFDDPSGYGSTMDMGVPKECIECQRLHVPDTPCQPYNAASHGIDAIRRFWGDSLREDYQ